MRILNIIRALCAPVAVVITVQVAQAQEPTSGASTTAAQTSAQVTRTTSARTFPQDPRRQIWFRHLKDLPTDIKTAGLHIEIKGAEQMTRRMTELFGQAGYNMVPAEQARYRYELQGGFSSDGKLKAQVPLAEILKGVEIQPGGNTSAAKAAGDVAFATVLAEQALKAGLTSPLWASGDILHAILNATGIRDKFNTALTGDRRGVCLLMCDYWEWSEQAVGLSWRDPRVDGMSTASLVNVGVFAEGVFAEELSTLAFNEFLRHHGVINVPAPDGQAQTPLKEMREIISTRVKRTRELIE